MPTEAPVVLKDNFVTFAHTFRKEDGTVKDLTAYDVVKLHLYPPEGVPAATTITPLVAAFVGAKTLGTVEYVGYQIPFAGYGWEAQFVLYISGVEKHSGRRFQLPNVLNNLDDLPVR
jgi:hypothetical protein